MVVRPQPTGDLLLERDLHAILPAARVLARCTRRGMLRELYRLYIANLAASAKLFISQVITHLEWSPDPAVEVRAPNRATRRRWSASSHAACSARARDEVQADLP
jgi:hypothetical protein